MRMKNLALVVAFATVAAAPAFAQRDRPPHGHNPGRPPVSAPEIDAGSGLASVAAILAALCLAWERRYRTS